MRLALLSDIHGNATALEAVLAHARAREVDRFINLGDILYGPLEPKRTMELLEQVDPLTIQGNQDRDVYDADTVKIAASPTLRHVVDQIGDAGVRWLRSLPKTAMLGEEIFACHGSPSSDMVYLLEDVASGFAIVRDDDAIVSQLGGISSPIILGGHTHTARVVHLSTGQTLINPGSVGLPAYDDELPVPHVMQSWSAHACYAIIEAHRKGWQVELFRVAYDHQYAAELARTRGRDDWARWLSTGRA